MRGLAARLQCRHVRLCRFSEAVLDILPNPNIGPFTKEVGEVVIDTAGWCVA
jgi:arsenate reductase